MAFEDAEERAKAVGRARNVLGNLRTAHAIAIRLRDDRALYQSGSDPTFNAAFDALYNTPADRTELAAMISDLTALCITDWEAAHRAPLGLP